LERSNFWTVVKALFEDHKLVRRLTLGWAVWLISVVVLRVTEPEILPIVNGHILAIVTAVIGILTTVIGFYQWSRHKEKTDARDPTDTR